MEPRILVLGVGNPLMRDEGIGPRVIELLLRQFDFPDNVQVIDGGTMGFGLLDMFHGIDHMIVVDAVLETGQPAGTVMLLTPEELSPNQVMHSLHDTRLIDVLQAADLIGTAPRTVAVGVQIETIEEWVLELSKPAEKALPIAAAAVLDQLRALGCEPVPHEGDQMTAAIIEAVRTYAPMPDTSSSVSGDE